ncbi:Transglutaminase-like superfamily protein [Sediminibacterium ginsengisoli]|uniref:Transglutaminase-like superfamily protein n=2 Tax=Sediminibacterium ginsengisoli TaxID=413434 RepID=A0A1T4P8R2_9BACT|nr:Transglutaminase-like superfamily protein [Sediminibacterium ginsengisoli]
MPADYIRFGEAWFLLLVARCMLVVLPFRRLAPLLGRDITAESIPLMQNGRQAMAAEISTAIRRGCRHAPFRTMCFEKAIAAKLMLRLRRMPSVLFLGVSFEKGGVKTMKAHAWLQYGDSIVTGGDEMQQYHPVGIFYS